MKTPKPSTPESANTARQSSHSSTKPPSVGASIGAIRIAVAVAASAEAAFAGPKWSRIVARMTDIAAPPPKACTTRATTSMSSDFATMPAALPSTKSASESSTMRLRP